MKEGRFVDETSTHPKPAHFFYGRPSVGCGPPPFSLVIAPRDINKMEGYSIYIVWQVDCEAMFPVRQRGALNSMVV